MCIRDSDVQHVWTALFDLYRATGQHPPFEDAALDYAVRFNRLAPLWASFPDMLDALVVGASGSPRDDKNEAGFRWTCPASLGAHAVTGLSARLTRAPQPWSFDWSALKTIEVSALDLLAEELRLAQNALSAITGEFTSDDLLGVIFSSFCIGK